jgi:hypothetical protein
VRRSYSIEPDSTLLQETLIVADPTPSEQEQPTPSAWRRVYRKAS